MNNRISWFEVLGGDAGKLQAFYGELFDWKFEVDAQTGYGVVPEQEGNIPGGVGAAPEGPGWTTFYVHVDDVKQAIEKATRLGARLLMPPTQLPQATIAVIAGSWPTMRWWMAPSILRRRSVSFSSSRTSGMPVHFETISAISSPVITGMDSPLVFFHALLTFSRASLVSRS